MENSKNNDAFSVYFMSFIILINIIAGGMSSRERDHAIKEKMDSISVKIDSIQSQLDKLNCNE